MKYTVTIVRPTGKKVAESRYSDLASAKAEFTQLLRRAAYARVLIVLVEEVEGSQETILEVDFVDGLAL